MEALMIRDKKSNNVRNINAALWFTFGQVKVIVDILGNFFICVTAER